MSKKVRINIEVPEELREQLKIHCIKSKMNMKVFLKKIILDAINNKKDNEWKTL